MVVKTFQLKYFGRVIMHILNHNNDDDDGDCL